MKYINIRSQSNLEKLLNQNSIRWQVWGKHTLTRPISKLWHMIQNGEVRIYKNTDGQIVLEVCSVTVDVYFPITRSVVDKLSETGYHLKNGDVAKRGNKNTIGGNIRPHESVLQAAKRAVKTELGRNFTTRLLGVGDKPDPIEHAKWFPELLVDRHRFKFVAVLTNPRLHGPNPYVRRKRSNGSPARYVTYEWFPRDVRSLPFVLREFIYLH